MLVHIAFSRFPRRTVIFIVRTYSDATLTLLASPTHKSLSLFLTPLNCIGIDLQRMGASRTARNTMICVNDRHSLAVGWHTAARHAYVYRRTLVPILAQGAP